MKRLVASMFIAMLCACGTMPPPAPAPAQKNFEWTGRPADELVSKLGAPTNIFLLDSGGRVFEYISRVKTTIKARDPNTIAKRNKGDPSLFEPPPEPGIYKPMEDERKSRFRKPDVYKKTIFPTCRFVYNVTADNIIESWFVEGDNCN
ncbi:MAG: hypothetical protein HY306_04730 [Nitrosomonadales bacterium]|nr:hypothetical protein [Nitrosomonadales bacterium]